MRNFIFIWFLISVLLVGATSLATVIWTGPSALVATWSFYGSGVVRYGSHLAALTLEDGGTPALEALERKIDPEGKMRFYVFDSSSKEIRGRQVPESVRDFAAHLQPGGNVQFMAPLRGLVAGNIVPVANGRTCRVVIWFPSRRAPGIPINGLGWVIRLGAIFGCVGLLCSWLAWRLSTPLARLRQTARKFASGDLSARAGSVTFPTRPPEYGELARDFDEMADRIETLVKAQRQLLRDVSHELRTPLTRLTLAVDNARDAPPPAVKDSLDRIDQEAERLNALIERIIHLSRLSAFAETPHREIIEFADFIDSIVSDADFEASARNRKVTILRSETCRWAGERELLREAIENIVRNAIRYAPEGSAVTVDACREGSSGYRISIRDCGPGVPAENIERIFDPFYRVPRGSNTDSPGFGLGLAIAKRAIGLHQGTIAARNLVEGGFEIAIRLPIPAPAA